MHPMALKMFALLLVFLLVLDATMAIEEEQDHYKVLGVEKGATLKQIKKAYKQLALKYHPDKVRDKSKKKAAEEKFFKINRAYETLSDPEKRKLYDMQKSGNPNPFTSGQHFGGPDFGFESMFSESFRRPQRSFHFAPEFQHQGGNFYSFESMFPEDHHSSFFEDHTFGDGSSFFGSHFGGHGSHHENHYSQHSGHSQSHQHASGHFSHMNSGSGQMSCRTVTQRVGNTVTTYTQCS